MKLIQLCGKLTMTKRVGKGDIVHMSKSTARRVVIAHLDAFYTALWNYFCKSLGDLDMLAYIKFLYNCFTISPFYTQVDSFNSWNDRYSLD